VLDFLEKMDSVKIILSKNGRRLIVGASPGDGYSA